MAYDGEDKKVKVDGRSFDAFFPKRHTTVKGIVYKYERWDANRGDPYANISNMKEYIILWVLWKGHEEWEKIVEGPKNTSRYGLAYYSGGSRYLYSIADVLFELETPKK